MGSQFFVDAIFENVLLVILGPRRAGSHGVRGRILHIWRSSVNVYDSGRICAPELRWQTSQP
jgi:hypothetical protein